MNSQNNLIETEFHSDTDFFEYIELISELDLVVANIIYSFEFCLMVDELSDIEEIIELINEQSEEILRSVINIINEPDYVHPLTTKKSIITFISSIHDRDDILCQIMDSLKPDDFVLIFKLINEKEDQLIKSISRLTF